MAIERFTSYTTDHPALDLELVVRDDARFTYVSNEHSYDYSITWRVDGRVERRSDRELVVVVESHAFSGPPDAWSPGRTVTIALDGDTATVDGMQLTRSSGAPGNLAR